jgi:phosphoglycolate phosphatase-like HAD superfamily hydrolase
VPGLDAQLRHWIFDLDGTLTVEVHDFPAIRRMLGLPDGKGILEMLAEMPREQAAPLFETLEAHELELAYLAKPALGADTLLAELLRRESRIGIFTRNSLRNLEITLEVAGLTRHFDPRGFITRESGPPKPRPEGIWRLLELWGGDRTRAVMIGNHRHDLDAGRAAGIMTIHVDPSGRFGHGEHADIEVRSLEELIPLLPEL